MKNKIQVILGFFVAALSLGACLERANASGREDSLGPVSAVTRTSVPVAADCERKFKRLSATKYQCTMANIASQPNDFVAKTTNLTFKPSAGPGTCSADVVSTASGYVMEVTLSNAGGGPGSDPDSCLHDLFKFSKLPTTSFVSLVYTVR